MDIAVLVSIIVVVVLVVLFGLFVLASYNSLTTLRARVDEAWRDIQAQLAQRAELIPVLVTAVDAQAKHDKAVLRSAGDARSEALAATTPAQATVAESHVQQSLRGVFTVADAYPQLTSQPDFLQMQSDLAEAEERIQASRRFYNGGVREFNTKLQVFPNRLFAKRPGFERREFFEAADGTSVAQPPRVQF